MKSYKVKIVGISPLLMNRPSQLDIADKSKDVKRETKTDKEQADSKLYKDSKGNIYIPSTWFRGAIIEAGKMKKMGGRGTSKATYSKVAGSSVDLSPFELTLKDEWSVFSILAVNPTTKGRNLLHRPKFDNWSCEFECNFDEEQIEIPVMKELIDLAGLRVGVGDWRPAKKGAFGKFQVVEWREI